MMFCNQEQDCIKTHELENAPGVFLFKGNCTDGCGVISHTCRPRQRKQEDYSDIGDDSYQVMEEEFDETCFQQVTYDQLNEHSILGSQQFLGENILHPDSKCRHVMDGNRSEIMTGNHLQSEMNFHSSVSESQKLKVGDSCTDLEIWPQQQPGERQQCSYSSRSSQQIPDDCDMEEQCNMSAEWRRKQAQKEWGHGSDGKSMARVNVKFNAPAENGQMSALCENARGCDKKTRSKDMDKRNKNDPDDKKFECGICRKSLATAFILKAHMSIHTGEFLYRCPVCDKGFAQKGSIPRHMIIHQESKHYSCTVCSRKFAAKRSLKRHMFQHVNDKKHSSSYVCDICNKPFSTKTVLLKHQKVHSGVKNENKCYKCDTCDARFSLPSKLKNHELTHLDVSDRPHECQICQRKFSTKSHLKRHMSIHTGERNHSCRVCGKQFVTSERCKEHSIKEHNIDLLVHCKICNKKFASITRLNVHLKIHEQKPFSCSYCKRRLSTEEELSQHILKKHERFSTAKTYKCTICKMSYKSKACFEKHLLMHSEGEIVCHLCDETFSSEKFLQRHLKMHNSIKEFTCHYCKKAFVTRGFLNRHLKLHTRRPHKQTTKLESESDSEFAIETGNESDRDSSP